MTNNVEVIAPEKVADVLAEQNSQLIYEGNQLNVIKGENAEYGHFLVINNAMGENLVIKLS
ncbi:hypothetical protein [Acinetobacter nosocomialis]|uniref:hypothetical protein n=1 Tax=Acinetobacter nosocomialis TaxID=106654 RepID=UPI0033B0406C